MEPPAKIIKLSQSQSQKKNITFITGNAKKLEEFTNILTLYNLDTRYNITSQKLDLPELQGANYYDIVKAKCRHASSMVGGPVIIEDSGLSFNSLGGLPGPYIKWFLDKIGNEGLNKMLTGFDDKSAVAHCIFAYCKGNDKGVGLDGKLGDIVIFDGRVEGQIVAPVGNNGFGWDAIFQPDGYEETFGEMEAKNKNEMSPRRKGIDLLANYLGNLYI
jgi:inosine triphosphate pyrophosphatase